jgi:hypothetical protein
MALLAQDLRLQLYEKGPPNQHRCAAPGNRGSTVEKIVMQEHRSVANEAFRVMLAGIGWSLCNIFVIFVMNVIVSSLIQESIFLYINRQELGRSLSIYFGFLFVNAYLACIIYVLFKRSFPKMRNWFCEWP